MQDDKRYNGWTNYETWCVSLWIDNDQYSQADWQERAQTAYGDATATDAGINWTREENAAYALAEALKDAHEADKDDLLEKACGSSSVWADLLGAALSEVDWREIAENMIENVDKEETVEA